MKIKMKKIRKKTVREAKNLVLQGIRVAVMAAVAGGAIWAIAAFVEPTAGPADSDQDFAQNILGTNDANNDFSSLNVVSNADGSIIERLEDIKSLSGAATDAASMSTTLFAGQQYIADNERGTNNAALASDYTSVRAAKLDNLDATISSRALDSEVGNASDAAAMDSTLFGGQQYIWDNRTSFGTDGTPGGWTCTVRTCTQTISDTNPVCTVTCSGNEKFIFGSCSSNYGNEGDFTSKYQVGQGYYCKNYNKDGSNTVTGYAQCCE